MFFIVACIQIHISFFHLKVQSINPLIVLKGNSTKCAHQIVFTGIYMWKKKKKYKDFCGSRWSGMKSGAYITHNAS